MKNVPQQMPAMQRTTQQASCLDYNRARQVLSRACVNHEFVWLEAQPRPLATTSRPFVTSGFAYDVHASVDGIDVPDFAIEVYEKGALCRYEVERQKIIDFAAMNENERIVRIRARARTRSSKASPLPSRQQAALWP